MLAGLADVVAVLLFAAIGRLSHAESADLLGLLSTAAPFLAGVALAWLARPVHRVPASLTAGALVWAAAVVAGLLVRLAFTRSLPLTFVLITAVSLGVLLLGWRGLARLVALRVARHSRSGAGHSGIGAA